MFKDQGALLFEVAAEVCYKMGGIHTVLVSKCPYVQQLWGDKYFFIGPYLPNQNYEGIFRAVMENEIPHPAVQQAVHSMRAMDAKVHVGYWLIEGRPFVLLIDATVTLPGYGEYFKAQLARHYNGALPHDSIIHYYLRFGFLLELFFKQLVCDERIIVQFHEYMTTLALPAIKELGMRTIFSTHATVIGRHHAPSFTNFREEMKTVNWEERAKRMSDYHKFCKSVEATAAKNCHVLTAVSNVLANECAILLGRRPDIVTPNGLNMSRLQGDSNARVKIEQAVEKHFGGKAGKEGGRTYYFFTSGRYEFKNKGYNIIIQALAKLNAWMKQSKSKDTVVAFFITDDPYAHGPAWLLKLKSIKRKFLLRKSSVFMFDVPQEYYDSRVMKHISNRKLNNKPGDRVKVLYHPKFINKQSPVLPMEYLHFASGCHLGIFPSLYEPYGFTPVECIGVQVPTVLSNVSGVGDYILNHTNIPKDAGAFIIDRTGTNDADNLFAVLQKFIEQPKDYTASLKEMAKQFDWSAVIKYYALMYEKALGQVREEALA